MRTETDQIRTAGEDLLVCLCRDDAPIDDFVLHGVDGSGGIFRAFVAYDCTGLVVVYRADAPASVASARRIREEFARRVPDGAACRLVEEGRLDTVLKTIGTDVLYVVPDAAPLPAALDVRDKFCLVGDDLWPWPAETPYENLLLAGHSSSARWTKHFLLGSADLECELENVRTIIVNRGKPGVPQYVLFTGETGTGKSYLTRNLPEIIQAKYDDPEVEFVEPSLERRNAKDYKYLQGNCASLTPSLADTLLFGAKEGTYTGQARHDVDGLIDGAGDGILFLDEVGDLPLETQGKLLTALEEKVYYRLGDNGKDRKLRHVNCTIVFGTNVDLTAAAREWEESHGTRGFRKDLLYRINSCHITLTPLRTRLSSRNSAQRTEVLEGLIRQSCAVHNLTLTQGARAAFEEFAYSYDWPGNFRDVRHLFEELSVHALGLRMGNTISRHAMKEGIARLLRARGASNEAPSEPERLPLDLVRDRLPVFQQKEFDFIAEVCARARTCSDAGRAFFGSEPPRNFGDAFAKHIQQFGIAFDKNAPGHLVEKSPAPSRKRGRAQLEATAVD